MKITIICAALSLLLSVNVLAQKLPTKQEKSLRAPTGVKIDGSVAEWGNKFQAHNNATDISYTIANDDEKLYLTVRATYKDVVDKILRGGITLTINHTTKKKDEKPLVVTYPYILAEDVGTITNYYLRKQNQKRDSVITNKDIAELNEVLGKKDKTIRITGVDELTEPEISIYNVTGIKAASKFDENLDYTFELAIPLKYLALPNNATDAFSYQVKVNEPKMFKLPPAGSMAPPPPPMAITSIAVTDFWGEYTLAK